MGRLPKQETTWKKYELNFEQNVKLEEVKLHFEKAEGRRLKGDEVFERMLNLAYNKVMEEKMQQFKKVGA